MGGGTGDILFELMSGAIRPSHSVSWASMPLSIKSS